MKQAKKEASTALAEIARDILPGSVVRTLSIEVRDEHQTAARASLHFEVEYVPTLLDALEQLSGAVG